MHWSGKVGLGTQALPALRGRWGSQIACGIVCQPAGMGFGLLPLMPTAAAAAAAAAVQSTGANSSSSGTLAQQLDPREPVIRRRSCVGVLSTRPSQGPAHWHEGAWFLLNSFAVFQVKCDVGRFI